MVYYCWPYPPPRGMKTVYVPPFINLEVNSVYSPPCSEIPANCCKGVSLGIKIPHKERGWVFPTLHRGRMACRKDRRPQLSKIIFPQVPLVGESKQSQNRLAWKHSWYFLLILLLFLEQEKDGNLLSCGFSNLISLFHVILVGHIKEKEIFFLCTIFQKPLLQCNACQLRENKFIFLLMSILSQRDYLSTYPSVYPPIILNLEAERNMCVYIYIYESWF